MKIPIGIFCLRKNALIKLKEMSLFPEPRMMIARGFYLAKNEHSIVRSEQQNRFTIFLFAHPASQSKIRA